MDLAIQYWQFSLVAILIFISYIIALISAERHEPIDFRITEMPNMKPIGIPTKGKGFWKGVWIWIMVTRTWEITKDFHYSINGEELIIPKGFVFDGVLLIGGLIHDYGYKYQTLLKKGCKNCNGLKTQKEMDITFRDINIDVNGFRTINVIAYWALRLGGFLAWKGHRKVGADWKSSIK